MRMRHRDVAGKAGEGAIYKGPRGTALFCVRAHMYAIWRVPL
jgi:hypothetical protein